MTDTLALRMQQYSTNLELLSQQKQPLVAQYCIKQSAVGSKAFRMLSQVDATAAVERATRAQPIVNLDVTQTGRWVYSKTFDWGTIVDDIDLMETRIAPQGAYVMSAIAALNRKEDDEFLSAFFGSANTGETGSTAVTFPSGKQVSVDEGGTASGLNVEKLRAAKQILLEGDVDLDFERIIVGVSPRQHDDLLALTQVVSTDFNDRPVLTDGMVRQFLGMNFVISNRLPTDGSSYRRLPVWVASGMGCGVWQETKTEIRKLPTYQGNPDYIEATRTKGYTRLEEAKCVEIKCNEA